MMSNNLLEVKDLSVNVEEQQILRGINLNIVKGRLMCLWDLTVQVNLHSDTL